MTKALVGHPFGSRKNVSNMNWPRKFRVEISAKFVSDHRVTVICERRGVGRITQRLPGAGFDRWELAARGLGVACIHMEQQKGETSSLKH